MKRRPQVYIIAGANGAGKTTFANTLLVKYVKCVNFVNADLIAKGLSPLNPERAAIKAGRILKEEISDLAKKRADFAFESTLSGRTHMQIIRSLKSKGYEVHIFYLWIHNVELSIQRVADRVKNGGHHVAVRDIRRRFGKSLNNFIKIYRNICNSWVLFDNSTQEPRIIAHCVGENIHIIDDAVYQQIGGNHD
ncbi:MAG: zeta toxin family protein [Candidatus Omnitrophica bacterium]|nr:zeta toxin family protein [Candidatus Omnitrophota bacterium]